MEKKTITMDTNYNHKLDCSMFIHVDLAPQSRVTEATAQNTLVEIITRDGSHPPVLCQLFDIMRLPLEKVANLVTVPSHGMTTKPFLDHLFNSYRNLSPTTEMAVYYYQKVTGQSMQTNI